MVNPGEEWLDAASAAELLGVKRATLYAYVSRGGVRTQPGEGRRQRYAREDLLRLKARSAARSGHAAVAAGALAWGEPVLDTAVSAIDPQIGPLYRGVAATELAARGTTFEEVAALLWATEVVSFPSVRRGAPLSVVRRAERPLERLALLLPLAAAEDPARFVTNDDAELDWSRRLIPHMALAFADDDAHVLKALVEETVAHALVVALGGKKSEALVGAVDRALVLSADHELNVSTFAARVVASSGADLYACVSAAVAALSGPAHGGVCDRIEAVLAEMQQPEDAARLVGERLARGDALVGFGHPLYPDGDPRGRFLLDEAVKVAPRAPVVRKALALRDAVHLAGAGEPTLDLGLVAIAGAARLRPGSAVALFAIGRAAGWIAHIREQRSTEQLLRPRARYVRDARDTKKG